MNKMIRLLITVALVEFARAAPLAAAADKPNFLFIYADDQRWDAMGVVQREQGERARFPWFQSPNMDRLAAEGVRFRNAFATCSLCAPSRAAFLTGRYNHLNGITDNHRPFPENAVTYATLLRAAGYRTAYIGKWHMGQQSGQRPGFDCSASFVGQGRYNNCPFEINGVSTPTTGWVDGVSADFAIAWLKQNHDRPFLMTVGLNSPHTPRGGNNLPERLRNHYAGETSRPAPNMNAFAIYLAPDPVTGKKPRGLAANSVHFDYFRHVAGDDESLDKLLDALDQLGLAENTVVIYSRDNGYYLGEHGLGDKRSLYEESLRIPMLVRYPRLFGEGKVVDEMVLNLDLAPTLLDLAGMPVPPEMQGRSWKALAAGQKLADWRQSFLAEYFNWGLHDLKHRTDGKLDPAGPQLCTLDEYEKNLRELVKLMQATGAKLIWATTTPVPEGAAGRTAGDELKYNEVARRVMNDLGVATDDLHALCAPKLGDWQLSKNVHFKPEGYAGLAAQVAAQIVISLKK